MNQNTLMSSPLDVFKDFEEIPDKMFETEKDEIYGLIHTIINSEDFIGYLADTYHADPETFKEEEANLRRLYNAADKGEYEGEKQAAILYFIGDILHTIEEVKVLGGAFKDVEVPIFRCHPDAILPKYATMGDAGMDVYTIEDVVVEPGETKVIPTGLKMAVPGGYYMMAVPKSGVTAKTSFRLANSPGTIDAGYRGEVGIIADNRGTEPVHFSKGSKLVQLILKKIPHIAWKEVDEEEWASYCNTERGEGGYGSTGK